MRSGDRHARRHHVIRGSLLLLVLVVLYRIYRPVPGQLTAMLLLFVASTVLLLFRTHTTGDALQSIRANRRQLDSYTTLVTALVTGIIVILLTYLVTYAMLVAAYMFRQHDIFTTLFFEAVQHVRLFESVHPLVFASLYIIAAGIVTLGVLLIYPRIPITHTRAATATTFLLSWTYTLSLLYLIVPVIHPLTLESLLLDALLILIWGILFDAMYGKPLLPNPFRRRREDRNDT